MKKILFSIFICCLLLFVKQGHANERLFISDEINEISESDTSKKFKHWKLTGITGLNITQTQFWNWAGGGNNNAHGRLFANVKLAFKKEKHSWENSLDAEYGIMYAPETKYAWRKPNDKINFASKYGYEFSKTWYVSVLGEFKSQFSKGYEYKTENGEEMEIYGSNWLSPSYTDLSIGLDWKPNTIFSIYFSPLAGRVTSCTDSLLRGKYGVLADKKFSANLGMLLKGSVNYEFKKNFKIISSITLYTPYTSPTQAFGNIDVDWDLAISYQFLKVMNVTLGTTLKYFDQVLIEDKDGHKRPHVQFREVFGVGIGYSF
ncbi:DUF3078 domain-containing protein [Bacteroidales bacterium OttesenSCG-928-C03]|nr:DUF3078 domain-containing protein [Bacteroidales bacterium OttesenSCG-928-E04]MDL2308681.1 DUF3078 domain-containing protein [Bacteroidales bacterium OttesenSCG-928-C03]MDL2325953.1 DUF3078 domain-containing protein [Bacteroidales bacterium OttesenSCG-928-A14]